MNIHDHISKNLNSKVQDYIINSSWHLPRGLQSIFHNLQDIISNTMFPWEPINDNFLWIHTTSDTLTLKDAYSFKKNHHPNKDWSNLIWNPTIPPSRSILIWRIFHHKMPTNGNLSMRDYQVPSMCNLYKKSIKYDMHLLLEFPFSIKI